MSAIGVLPSPPVEIAMVCVLFRYVTREVSEGGRATSDGRPLSTYFLTVLAACCVEAAVIGRTEPFELT